MERSKLILLGIVSVVGVLFVLGTYNFSTGTDSVNSGLAEEAPELSSQPFHMQFLSEEVCLACHAQEKVLAQFGLTAPKIAHEPSESCSSCHKLPQS